MEDFYWFLRVLKVGRFSSLLSAPLLPSHGCQVSRPLAMEGVSLFCMLTPSGFRDLGAQGTVGQRETLRLSRALVASPMWLHQDYSLFMQL